MSGTYSDLEVWKAAMELAVHIYRLTSTFPKEETYGLTSQLRRAAVSVPSNIAEGKGRSSDKEVTHFLSLSRGSLFEIETQVTIARQLGYLNVEQCETVLHSGGSRGTVTKRVDPSSAYALGSLTFEHTHS